MWRWKFCVVTSTMSRNFSLRFLTMSSHTVGNGRRWRKCKWRPFVSSQRERGPAAARALREAYFGKNAAESGARVRMDDNARRVSPHCLRHSALSPTPERSFSIGTPGEMVERRPYLILCHMSTGCIELAKVQYEEDCERRSRVRRGQCEAEASERVTPPQYHSRREQQIRIRPTPMTILRA